MALPAAKFVSKEEYLDAELYAAEKHEYLEGQVIAMAGASAKHNLVLMNLGIHIGSFLKDKDCFALPSEMRVTTPDFNSYLYPDLSIVCGQMELEPGVFDTLTNPSVIIEVLSPTTMGNDRVFKFYFYRKIPTLREYIIVDPTQYYAEISIRQPDNSWNLIEIRGENSSLPIRTVDLEIPFREIYFRVEL